ncbi:MAG: proline dehydrogenase [Bacteroidetes bacterium]|nr:proline dehydrogenase [Bacteroidota bacterium]
MAIRTIDFNDTEIAFAYRKGFELIKAYNMFYLMKYDWLVKVGTDLTMRAWERGVTFPISIAMKPTVYRLFCGGESLERAGKRIARLYEFGVQVILDYGVEAKETDADFDSTANEVKKAIRFAHEQASVPMVSSKFTGLVKFEILEMLHAGHKLNAEDQASYDRSKQRIDSICRLAHELSVSISVDAEESWIQDPLNDLVHAMMEKYNKERPIVYNTFQLYLKERRRDMERFHNEATVKGYIYAVKLVRGAYMEKEGIRASEFAYANPVQSSKDATDADYNLATHYCLNHLSDMAVCVATHNEQSVHKAVVHMDKIGVKHDDERVLFSQLYSMSDHISFNLARHGYRVAKYMPYGPLKDVIPYLVRRAQENTSVAGQMGRELSLLKEEMRRRNLMLF